MANKSQFVTDDIWTSADKAYIDISVGTTLLSIIGSTIIILLFFAIKELRTTSRQLLVYLSVADIVVGLSSVVQARGYVLSLGLPDQTSKACQVDAGLWVWAQVCAALWTSVIVIYLFLCVSLRWVTVANRIVFMFHIFCWGMPVVVTTLSEIFGVYGYKSADILIQKHPTWCWISDSVSNPKPWYLLTVEGWVLAACLLICVLYVPITCSIIKGKGKAKVIAEDDVIEELAKQTANEQLRFIPVIYVCTRLWGTLHFLFARYPDDANLRSSDWLMLFRAFGDNSQGLVNAVFFCLATKQIRTILTTRLRCCRIFFGICCSQTKSLGRRTFMRLPNNLIVRKQHRKTSRTKALDGSDLDISGISLDLPSPNDSKIEEDEVIFER
ncbi:hypothetical protein RRG08_018104 [Elysia crispata]|uniref:G-protein coupled receptors family 2 profile 2 domain-containing protein n=1 Tax=Elysia crispata TaxID=231223 RepID=A0AAE1DE55_9GAST|nr:hypothetical protein RRG08_018104 [Elysia crispata]